MLSFTNSEDKQSQCFHLLGTAKPAKHSTHLISDNTLLISANTSLISACGLLSDCGGEDSCSFYSGPSEAAILSFGEQAESCGSIAYASSGSSESCGSVAYSGGASVSVCSSGGGCSSGGCSYSC